MGYFVKSIDGATAVGPGTPIEFDTPRIFVSAAMQIVSTGSPSTLVVNLEISIDGVHYVDVRQVTNPANGEIDGVSNQGACLFVRANLVTLSGGSSPTVDVFLAVVES